SGRQWFVSSLNRSGRDAVRLLRSSRTTLLGDGLPVPFSRKRCTHRIAELPLTSNCSAAFICLFTLCRSSFFRRKPTSSTLLPTDQDFVREIKKWSDFKLQKYPPSARIV
ncbi:MAG TPA: hypothetical protein VK684_03160, partial [Edaphobacter sp.]|nr:hypothetical protein [Edaphobacter sp.]